MVSRIFLFFFSFYLVSLYPGQFDLLEFNHLREDSATSVATWETPTCTAKRLVQRYAIYRHIGGYAEEFDHNA